MSNMFVQTLAENKTQLDNLVTHSSEDSQQELLAQVSQKAGIDKESMLAELEKELGINVDKFFAQIRSGDFYVDKSKEYQESIEKVITEFIED